MITPPANVEVLDNSTTPRDNTGAKQFAGNWCIHYRVFIVNYIHIIIPTKTVVVVCLGPSHVSMDTVMV